MMENLSQKILHTQKSFLQFRLIKNPYISQGSLRSKKKKKGWHKGIARFCLFPAWGHAERICNKCVATNHNSSPWPEKFVDKQKKWLKEMFIGPLQKKNMQVYFMTFTET